MTITFVSLRRIPALFVAITLFAVPIASAQSRDVAPHVAVPTNAVLISPAAFARLVQQPKDVGAAATAAAKVPPRLGLLRQAAAEAARQAQTTLKQPQQKSWASRHPELLGAILLGVGVLVGVLVYAAQS